jgi:phosphate transport system substrate-binding protein
MNRKLINLITVTFLATIFAVKSGNAFSFFSEEKNRSYIYIVGSSTVSTFAAAISEEYNRSQSVKNILVDTPVVESTGTGEGFKFFCSGVGLKYPDFVDASRQIHESEIKNCNRNGVNKIAEIKIGYDGIVIGNSVGAKKLNLTKEQIFLALAEKVYDKKSGKMIKNPHKKWSDIDPSLPNSKIVVYGPPATSGTREVFVDLLMKDFCFHSPEISNFYKDEKARDEQCHKIRSDGHFIESGENHNVIVQHLQKNREAVGIVGFNFLVINRDVIQAVTVDNIEPSFETITSKRYELSRPLFIYFKKEHLKLMPQMHNFIKEIVSPETIGPKGYLKNSGLVTLGNSEFNQIRKSILLQLAEEEKNEK